MDEKMRNLDMDRCWALAMVILARDPKTTLDSALHWTAEQMADLAETTDEIRLPDGRTRVITVTVDRVTVRDE